MSTDDLDLGRQMYGCCEHCEHDTSLSPHSSPCPYGCDDDDE